MTDKVRASRDGHEFHEAWAARKALQMVLATDGLVGIAVEGLAPADRAGATTETVDIADVVLYYGAPSFEQSDETVIVQVKYSRRSQLVEYRAADAKKTISKFATTFLDYETRFGTAAVRRKLSFEILTNRPIHPALIGAIEAIASGSMPRGDVKKQVNQLQRAAGIIDDSCFARFARKLKVTGLAGSLQHNKQSLARVLADWSVAPDPIARARLGNMRQLLRDKAGLAGEGRNLITRTDVLDALELQGPENLLPCPTAFPQVGEIVPRAQLEEVAKRIPDLTRPMLIHGDGGIGKTVFLQSLTASLSSAYETELFDCFGGGAYRAPEDARHLPKRGLIHIVNRLACRGLCDPLLPINESFEDLIKAFRARLAQAVATIQRGSPGKKLVLILDAIDNAAVQAADKHEPSFPTLLLESFQHNGPVPDVRLVVSCRTYRRDISRGHVPCDEIPLRPFTVGEVTQYIRDRMPEASDAQIQVAFARSQGNARILEHLVLGDSALLEPSDIDRVIKLDDLLRHRIRNALEEARHRGYNDSIINAFLAGLSVLPAPVPIDEYAAAQGMELSAVKSFAADLSPLLELTRLGVMFRDEPTETLLRHDYAADADTLRTLAANLLHHQTTSVYAATALPALLQKLDDGATLFALAFDERYPTSITSVVGREHIRYARLTAAALQAARHSDFDRLVHLLVELSTLAAANERGTAYVLDNPDLVVTSHDTDATRRLFETRTSWAGTRYARVAIASTLAGDLSDGVRHAMNADDWIEHFFKQGDEYRREVRGPEVLDLAALPFYLIAKGQERDAVRYLDRWRDWYSFQVTRQTLSLVSVALRLGAIPAEHVDRFLDALSGRVGSLASSLAYLELDEQRRGRLIRRLANACAKHGAIEVPQSFEQERAHTLHEGLLKATGIALSMNRRADARRILAALPSARPRLWLLSERPLANDSLLFVIRTALHCAAACIAVTDRLLLPQELAHLGERIAADNAGSAFRKALLAALDEEYKADDQLPAESQKRMSRTSRAEAERFVTYRLEGLVELAQALANVFTSSHGSGAADLPFVALMGAWEKLRLREDAPYETDKLNPFFDALGAHSLLFALWTRDDLSSTSAEALATTLLRVGSVAVQPLIRLVAVLACRPHLQALAGRTAKAVKTLIERDDDVGQRASFFAELARAIVLASVDEATAYFRVGLEQMDAIGSGDYAFTNELLGFAGSLRGDELDEPDFHTLSNICELNLYESDKFPWGAFAHAMARISGCRALAKLGRWADRDKVSLDYTLLPYLVALVAQDKIAPEIAICLLRISTPVEFYECGTAQFAELIAKKCYPNSEELLTELVTQFRESHPGVFMSSTLHSLHNVAVQELGEESIIATYLACAAPKAEVLIDEANELRNHPPFANQGSWRNANSDERVREALQAIDEKTDPTSEESMADAIDEMNAIGHVFDQKREFFRRLRDRVPFGARATYLRALVGLQNLDVYSKLHELIECKGDWNAASIGLDAEFRGVARPILRMHTADFISYGYLSHLLLTELADASGWSHPDLALELIGLFAAPDWHTPPAVWLNLAAIICERTRPNEGQAPLKRLLNSKAAQLASSVVDGPWKEGLYPASEPTSVAAGLIWLALGSPTAAQRWLAAHSVRRFAKFARWDVLDALMQRIDSTDAHPYQASELRFYFFHARLWLLIAIARVAMDHAPEVAKYETTLKAIAFDTTSCHVLMRDFAARALLTCAREGAIGLSAEDEKALNGVNKSSFQKRKSKQHFQNDFYGRRPDSSPEPENDFFLDYDFDKLEVSGVSNLFDRCHYEIRDAMTGWVRRLDPRVESMYDDGGRSRPYRDRHLQSTSRYHQYGYQLGWHALYAVAGECLSKYPVVQRPYDDRDPWEEWLDRHLLTRKDGLWLADGVDWQPVDAQVNLAEAGESSTVAITGNESKLLSLLNIGSESPREFVVAGRWSSYDGIGIYITSALAPKRHAEKLALALSQDDPFQMWLPDANDYNGANLRADSDGRPYEPWLIWRESEAGIDETDPLGVPHAHQRILFSKNIPTLASLRPRESFERSWVDSNGQVLARSEVWGRSPAYDEAEGMSGQRLVCHSQLVGDVLAERDAELVVLIRLRKYVKSFGDRQSEYWHTTAAVRIDASLDCHLYRGVANKLHESKY